MSPYLKDRLKTVCFSIAVVGVTAVAAFYFFRGGVYVPARVMHKIEIKPSPMIGGQPFTASIDQTMNLLCPFEIHWSLIRDTDRVEVIRVIEPTRPARTQLGLIHAENIHIAPRNSLPGGYQYLSQVYDICPGHTYVSTFQTAVQIK